MKSTSLNIPDVLLIEPDIFEDSRGFFLESFNHAKFEQIIGRKIQFVQDNHSKSIKGVLRGLHYQDPKSQGKLVRVIRGEIFDVAVDIREGSPTFGKWAAEILSEENKRQLWVPEGFAHGFLTLSDVAEVLYKVSDYYAPEFEKCIIWNDPDLNIKWPIKSLPLLSLKDHQGNRLAKAN
jgi:dTDP-4-dehydrorhamnose 3,5-epimerase